MIYRDLIVALWLVLFATWAASARGNKATVYSHGQGARIAFLVLLLALVAAEGALPAPFRRPVLPGTSEVRALSVALCASGIAFAIWARFTIGRNWSATPTLKRDHELERSGPYRLVRHPIYTGILLAGEGTLASCGSYRDLLTMAYILVAVRLKIGIEERLMLRQFPQDYPAYQRTAKALIPFVW